MSDLGRMEQVFEGMTLAQWRAVTSIILDGAFNCVQACLPHLFAIQSRIDDRAAWNDEFGDRRRRGCSVVLDLQ